MFIVLEIIQSKINDKAVFSYLNEKLEELDISLYTEYEIREIEEYFYNLYSAVDARRKFGIEKNGVCLLVAYCFEALQHNPENL